MMRRHRFAVAAFAATILALSGCSASSPAAESEPEAKKDVPALVITAIPDQDPEKLARLYDSVADRVADATGLEVTYLPVTDYPAVVRGFAIGDIQLAWVGGLTGVQAREQEPGTVPLAQRDIDADFHSVFLANTASGLKPIDDESGLKELAGHSFTFGSETSTSGRLMPQFFMTEGGLDLDSLAGSPGFSGSHDATVEAVAAGSFEAGAANEQVWEAIKEAGEVDLSKTEVIWRTPGYADYHWIARPDLDETYGEGTTKKIQEMLLSLDPSNADDADILDLFGAKGFVKTEPANYDQIQSVAEGLGLLE